MREIPVILLVCASVALCQQQNLDDLLNQIFTQDNSGVTNNQGSPPPTFQETTIPTPILVSLKYTVEQTHAVHALTHTSAVGEEEFHIANVLLFVFC